MRGKWSRKVLLAALGCCAGLCVHSGGLAQAQNIPIISFEDGSYVPDWAQINFGNLPPLPTDGSIPSLPANFVQQLGYDPARAWLAGTAVEEVVALGDFQEAFGLQQFSLNDISGITGLNSSLLSLSDVGFLQQQSVADVVTAVGLENFTPSQIAPLGDLLNSSGFGFGFGNTQTFGDLLSNTQSLEALQSIELGQFDLSSFGLDSIPGLSQTQLSQFAGWEGFRISEVPGLSNVPFNQFPIPLSVNVPIPIAKVDVTYGTAEARRINTITGSYREGFAVPCNQPSCAYLELTDAFDLGGFRPLHGKQWIAGTSQRVSGGSGVCSGTEPTGRHPFGPAFKVVLENVVESEGRGDFMAYFSISCGFFGRTPYIFPLFPLPSVYEKQNVILGF